MSENGVGGNKVAYNPDVRGSSEDWPVIYHSLPSALQRHGDPNRPPKFPNTRESQRNTSSLHADETSYKAGSRRSTERGRAREREHRSSGFAMGGATNMIGAGNGPSPSPPRKSEQDSDLRRLAIPSPEMNAVVRERSVVEDAAPASQAQPAAALRGLPRRVVIAGNPGAGKSTLLNSLLGAPVFESGVSLGGGLTKTASLRVVGGVAFIDTPGLFDSEEDGRAAAELSFALSDSSGLRVIFVVSLEDGRLRASDVKVVRLIGKALLKAGVDISGKYGLILNKVESRVSAELHIDEGLLKALGPLFSGDMAVNDRMVGVVGLEVGAAGRSGVVLREASSEIRRVISSVPEICTDGQRVTVDVEHFAKEVARREVEMNNMMLTLAAAKDEVEARRAKRASLDLGGRQFRNKRFGFGGLFWQRTGLSGSEIFDEHERLGLNRAQSHSGGLGAGFLEVFSTEVGMSAGVVGEREIPRQRGGRERGRLDIFHLRGNKDGFLKFGTGW